MTRCLSCNGILKSQEKSCFGCGELVVEIKSNKGKSFSSFISALFIASLLLTGASLFTDRTPPFAACSAASVVLLFVKRAADEFTSQES